MACSRRLTGPIIGLTVGPRRRRLVAVALAVTGAAAGSQNVRIQSLEAGFRHHHGHQHPATAAWGASHSGMPARPARHAPGRRYAGSCRRPSSWGPVHRPRPGGAGCAQVWLRRRRRPGPAVRRQVPGGRDAVDEGAHVAAIVLRLEGDSFAVDRQHLAGDPAGPLPLAAAVCQPGSSGAETGFPPRAFPSAHLSCPGLSHWWIPLGSRQAECQLHPRCGCGSRSCRVRP